MASRVSLPVPTTGRSSQTGSHPPQPALARQIGRALLAAAWAATNEAANERFLAKRKTRGFTPLWYRTADGWQAPLWRRTPRPGAHGSPVVLSIGMGLDARCMDLLPDCSLVDALYEGGFDTYLLTHRGDKDARAPQHAQVFDFDDIVAHDVPAAISSIRDHTGAQRVLWIGHGMGGLLLYSHLARNGDQDLAGGVAICAPILFPRSRSTARQVGRVAQWIPSEWRIPHRAVQRWLLGSGREPTLAPLSARMNGPTIRRIALDGATDLSAGLIRQIARWHQTGRLCDRLDQFDDLTALNNRRMPLLGIATPDDPICSLEAARAAVTAIQGAEWHPLPAGWGHLDPILGPDAPQTVFPRILQWLRGVHQGCWNRDM